MRPRGCRPVIDQPRTDPLRRPGNQGDSLFAAHDAALRLGSTAWPLLGAVTVPRDGRCNALRPRHREAEADRRGVIDADPPDQPRLQVDMERALGPAPAPSG